MSADAYDSSRQVRDPWAPVRLSMTKIDISDISDVIRPGALLLNVGVVDSHEAMNQAMAWAHVRGYDQLLLSIERAFDKELPESGCSALINKPLGLLIPITWPWAP